MAATLTTYGKTAYDLAVKNKTVINVGKMVISSNTGAVNASMTEITNITDEYTRLNMVIGLNAKDLSFTAFVNLPVVGGYRQVGVYDTAGKLLLVERVNFQASTPTKQRIITGVSLLNLSNPTVFASPLFAPTHYSSSTETLRVIKELYDLLDRHNPRAPEGHVYNWTGTPPRTNWLMRQAAIVDSDEGLRLAKNSVISMEEIFNTWYRFSHRKNNYVYPADANEINGWALNANKELYTTVNSGSYIGFISPTKHINFEFDVQIHSTNGDDDAAALVAAFTTEGGIEHNISVIRCMGGYPAFVYRIYYNYNQSNEILLANLDSKVVWGDGVHGSNRASTPYKQVGGWNRADIASGVRLKVTRNGDIITFQTSDFGSTTFVPEAQYTLNLNSREELAPLRGPAAYGYGSFSQPSTFFNTTLMLDKDNVIADTRDGKVYAYNGTEWLPTLDTISKTLGNNSILYSKLNKRVYHIDQDGQPRRII